MPPIKEELDVTQDSIPEPPDWPALRRVEWEAAGTRPEQAAEVLANLAAAADAGQRLGTKEELRARCGVSVGTFNEAVRLAQARGVVTVRPGRTGGIFAGRQSALVRLGNSVLSLDDDATSVADAVRLRDALDPLLIEDALRHAGADDLVAMGRELGRMRAALDAVDPVAFLHANWALHARIAEVTPNLILRSFYLGLLEIIQAHTLAVSLPGEQPLAEHLAVRYELHAALVDALAARDHGTALRLIADHRVADRVAEPADRGIVTPSAARETPTR